MADQASGWFIGASDENDTKDRERRKRIRRSFLKALESKYSNHAEHEPLKNVEIVFHGKPKSDEKYQLGYLRNVVLSDAKISLCGLTDRSLKDVCPYVVDLDISGNLFDEWKTVFTIVSQLDQLKYLNLSRNPLKAGQKSLEEWTGKLPDVENLVLNRTEIPWTDVLILSKLFHQLRELHICANGYKEVPDSDHRGMYSVETLRLNDNRIESWQEIWKLKHLPKLKSLILSGNPLQDIYFHDNDLDRQCSCDDTSRVKVIGKSDLDFGERCLSGDEKSTVKNGHTGMELETNDKTHTQENNITGYQTDGTIDDVKIVKEQESLKYTSLNLLREEENQTNEIEVGETHICVQENDKIIETSHDRRESNRHEDEINDEVTDILQEIVGEVDNLEARQASYDNCKAIVESLVTYVGDDQTVTHDFHATDDQVRPQELSSETKLTQENVVEVPDKLTDEVIKEEAITKGNSSEDRINERKLTQKNVIEMSDKLPDEVVKEVKMKGDFSEEPMNESICISKGSITDNKSRKTDEITQIDGQPIKEENELYQTDENTPCPVHEEMPKPFHTLENICLSQTRIGKWKHLAALSAFPSLKSVRIKDVKLGSRLNQEDRRKLFLPCLPNIKSLNGSEVTVTEREKGERYLLRYFCDKPQKPHIYSTLEKKHGTLTPLVDIDISRGYQENVTLTFVYQGEAVFQETVSVRHPVGKLRLIIANKLCLYASLKTFNIYHKYCNPEHQTDLLHTGELEQLVLDTLPMSRFDIMDGDEIHIDMNDKFAYGAMQFVYIKNYLPKKKELLDELKNL